MNPEVIAALGFFGAIVLCPLVYMLTKHQKAMAEIIHRSPAQDVNQRLELLERELRELKATQHELVIRADDQRELRQRLP